MQEANFKSSACHSMRSEAVLEERCLGQTTCMFVVSDELFGDPCKGRPKWLAARLACGDHTALDFAAREVCPSARRWCLPRLPMSTHIPPCRQRRGARRKGMGGGWNSSYSSAPYSWRTAPLELHTRSADWAHPLASNPCRTWKCGAICQLWSETASCSPWTRSSLPGAGIITRPFSSRKRCDLECSASSISKCQSLSAVSIALLPRLRIGHAARLARRFSRVVPLAAALALLASQVETSAAPKERDEGCCELAQRRPRTTGGVPGRWRNGTKDHTSGGEGSTPPVP